MTEGIKQGLQGRLSAEVYDLFYLLYDKKSSEMDEHMREAINVHIDCIIHIIDTTEPIFWARKCDATGKGMNDGYVFGDGEKYFASESDALRYAQSLGYKDLDDAYSERAFYWTEWEEDRDYVEIDGKLIEIS